MMTRDSKWWWVGIATAIIAGLTGNLNLLQDAFVVKDPATMKQINAVLQIAALALGIISAKMSMSPLPISAEGRAAAIEAKVEQMSKAELASTVASIKGDAASKATSEAADAANTAKDISKKAGDL